MELGKWQTNSTNIANAINENMEITEERIEIKDEYSSVLGLSWIPSSDCFVFNVRSNEEKERSITKRNVVSEIAMLYDPQGYLAPIVMNAKAFIQKLWKLKIDWDDVLNNELTIEWNQFYDQLRDLNEVRIPRWLQTTKTRELN